MPPKSPAKARNPSPAKAPPAAAAAKKAPAGSATVAKAASVSPAAKRGAKTVAGSAAVATAAAASPPKPAPKAAAALSTEAAALRLQALGRGGSERVALGAQHKRFVAHKMQAEAEARIAAASRAARKQREQLNALKKDAESRAAARRRALEELSVAAFDGDVVKLRKIIDAAPGGKEILLGKDVNHNFAIGEAAVNGQVDAIKFLLEYGAPFVDPNARGQYERTPLWRAAFNSHAAAVQLLLERGADPRLRAQGQSPSDLGDDATRAALSAWDIAKTDAMLRALDSARAADNAARAQRAAAEGKQLDDALGAAKARLGAKQRELLHLKQERERRIVEHDFVMHDATKPRELLAIALGAIKDAEAAIARVADEVEEARTQLVAARAIAATHKLKQQQGADADGGGDDDDAAGDLSEYGKEFAFRRLADVVFEDSDDLWQSSGRWPLIVDLSGRAATFLRYRNSVFVDSFSSTQLERGALRRAALGALRFGKPLVIDLRDVPMLEIVEERATPELFALLVSRALVTDRDATVRALVENWKGDGGSGDAVREADMNDPSRYSAATMAQARVVFLTSSLGLDEKALAMFTVLRVEQPE